MDCTQDHSVPFKKRTPLVALLCFIVIGVPPAHAQQSLPSIASFSPISEAPGMRITISGGNFSGATKVEFNGKQAVSYTIDSDTQITAILPIAATTGPVSVTNEAGTNSSNVHFTVMPSSGENLTFQPSDDAHIYTTKPTNNYANAHTLRVREETGNRWATYLKFNVSGISGSFHSAVIRLFAEEGSVDGGSMFSVSNNLNGSETPWTEETLKSENAPGIHGTALRTVGAVASNSVAEFDVTSEITGNGVFSFAIINHSMDVVKYSSKESLSPPELVITTTGGVNEPPTIRTSRGDSAPGSAVHIWGDNFSGTSMVTFNETPASFAVVSDGYIRATVPETATSGPVYATTSFYTARLIDWLHVTNTTISTFAPTSGPVGTVVTLTGSNFSQWDMSVYFNGLEASFLQDSYSQVRATVPVGATSGPISVISGADTVDTAMSFSVTPSNLPLITSFTPGSGIVGRVVTLKGINFTGTESVSFNDTVASFSTDSDTLIYTTVPVGATSGPIKAANSHGAGLSRHDFSVRMPPTTPPEITSFEPTSGLAGTRVTIYGNNFLDVTDVAFNGTPDPMFTIVYSRRILATVPVGATNGAITVMNAAGTVTSAASFTVSPTKTPSITSFTPIRGPVGTEVTLYGHNLTDQTRVYFNGNQASILFDSETQLRATVPEGTRTGTIRVSNADGTATSDSDFTVTTSSGGEIVTFFVTDDSFVRSTRPTRNYGDDIELRVARQDAKYNTYLKFDVTGLTTPVLRAAVRLYVTTTGQSGTIYSVSNDFAGTNTPWTESDLTYANVPVTTSAALDKIGRAEKQKMAEFDVTPAVTGNGTFSFAIMDGYSDKITYRSKEGNRPPELLVVTSGPNLPSIESFHPQSGPAGTEVTILGANFHGTTDVAFNDSTVSFTYDSDSQLRATIPVGVTTGPITVTNRIGTHTSTADFTVTLPTITSFTPTYGPTGTEVTISGSNFNGTTDVTFNGVSAVSFSVDSNSRLRATVPVSATSGIIAITNSYGTATFSPFIVITAPTITSFTPTIGPKGTRVLVFGNSLAGTISVKFNGIEATQFWVDGNSRIRAIVPEDATTGPISVTNSEGMVTSIANFTVKETLRFIPAEDTFVSSANPSGNYGHNHELRVHSSSSHFNTYLKFNVTGVTLPVKRATVRLYVIDDAPSGGSIFSVSNYIVTTGKQWTQDGLNFSNAPAITGEALSTIEEVSLDLVVEFDVTPAITGNGVFSFAISHGSSNTTKYISREGASYGDTTPELVVTAVSEEGTANLPLISSFSPSNGMVGTYVTLAGSNFIGTTLVSFNGVASGFSVISNDEIRAQVPTGASSGPIEVRNEDGTDRSDSDFIVTELLFPPKISSFTPTEGPVGTEVTVSGQNFNGTSSVKFNGLAVSGFTIDSNTRLRATVPTRTTTGPISVTNPDGTTTSVSVFTVNPSSPLTITSFSPASVPVGKEVDVRGTSFTGVSRVMFNGVDAAKFTVYSDTKLLATVPWNAKDGPISVTNGNKTATSASDFVVYIPAPPRITSFTPTSGSPCMQVVVRGKDFMGTSSVKFNETEAASFIVDSNNQLRATIPSEATTGPIAVTNADGTRISESDFTVYSGPDIPAQEPQFQEFQSINTNGAVDWEFSSIGEERYLAVANNLNDSKIYRWDGAQFMEFQSIPTTQARSLEFLTIGHDHYLAVAHDHDNPKIYRWHNSRFVEFQSTPTDRMLDLEFFTIGNENYLAAANHRDSMIYRWDNTGFVEFQPIPTRQSQDWTFFTIDSDAYLVVSNYITIKQVDVSSKLYRWDGARFVELQTMFTDAARDFEYFRIDGVHYLAAANHTHESDRKGYSKVYRWNGSEFLEYQSILTSGAADWEFFTTGGDHYLAVANEELQADVFNTDSKIYRWDGAGFVEHQSIPTIGASDWKFFTIGNTHYLAVANAHSDYSRIYSRATTDSKPELPPSVNSFIPTDDAFVRSTRPSANYGRDDELRVRLASSDYDTYIKFSVAGLRGPVQKAVIRLFVVDYGSAGGSIFPVSNHFPGTTTSWTEEELNFNNAPKKSGTALSKLGQAALNTTIEFDVTSAISGNGVFSFAISNQNRDTAKYSSKEGVTPPELVITTGSEGETTHSPSITSLNPASGLVGSEVTLIGSHFTGTSSVSFNGAAADFSVISDNELHATVPNATAGGPITITTADGRATSSSNFTVTGTPPPPSLPIITSFAPASGLVGTEVIISGSHFAGTTLVSFNNVPASFSFDSDSQLRASVPNGAKTGSVTVTNAAGLAISSTDFVVTTSSSDQTVTFNPTDDAFVRSSRPTTNYASHNELSVRLSSADYNTYLKFNVSDLTGPVQKAVVRMHVVDDGPDGGSIYSVRNELLNTSNPWTEGTLNFKNAPAIAGAALSSVGQANLNATAEFDVTSAVKGNGVFSFAISNANSNATKYSSKEGIVQPELIVTSSSGEHTASPPGISAFIPINGSVGHNVIIIGNHFADVTKVAFNGVASGFTIDSDRQLHATVPQGATTGPISITGAGSTVSSVTNFTVTGVTGSPSRFTFKPTDDTFAWSANPDNNYASSRELRVREPSRERINTYLKFEVSGLSRNAERAVVRLTVLDASDDGGSIYSVSNAYQGAAVPWHEGGLSWHNAPLIEGSPLSPADDAKAGDVVEFDVTTAISGDGVYSFAIANNSNDICRYHSKEGLSSPELIIETSTSLARIVPDSEPELRNQFRTERAEEPEQILPDRVSILPNYPNPFNMQTMIEYTLPEKAHVKLVLYNLRGQEVRVLVDESQPPGFKTVRWNGKDNFGAKIGSGIYFLRLNVAAEVLSRKIILQK